MVQIPLHISAIFIALVFTIAFFIVISLQACGRKATLPTDELNKIFIFATISILFWLVFILVVAERGILNNFHSMPPRIFIVTLPIILLILLLFLSPKFLRLTDHLNPFWLIYPQCFRIIMELILWLLYRYHIVPRQMTFEGWNFDILAGLTAPFVAYYCFRKQKWSPIVAIIWNFGGLLLLANIIIISMLSTPYPFRYFMNEPANTIIFNFPFVWLPSFVVPFALLLHLLSLRRLFRKNAAGEVITSVSV